MDIIRRALLALEADTFPDALADVAPEILQEHLVLLSEAGFIELPKASGLGNAPLFALRSPTRITWNGHEFLARVRSETFWKRAKGTLGASLNTISVKLLEWYLDSLIKEGL